MSKVLWCDPGNHAFSANDPERRNFTETRRVPAVRNRDGYTVNAHDEVTTEIDICGPHFRKQSLFLEAGKDTEVDQGA